MVTRSYLPITVDAMEPGTITATVHVIDSCFYLAPCLMLGEWSFMLWSSHITDLSAKRLLFPISYQIEHKIMIMNILGIDDELE